MQTYEEKVFRNLYRNMDYIAPHNRSNVLMNLFSVAIPIVTGVVILTVIGFFKIVHYLAQALEKSIARASEQRKVKAEQRRQDKEMRMKTALEQAKAEKLAEERLASERMKQEQHATRQEIRDKAVTQLRHLVDDNGGIINYAILQTKQANYFGKDDVGEGRLCAWIQFTLYDCNKKEIISINDLINIVCYDNMTISSKDGKYLKGSIILPYLDIMDMEDRLRTLLQTRVALVCNL